MCMLVLTVMLMFISLFSPSTTVWINNWIIPVFVGALRDVHTAHCISFFPFNAIERAGAVSDALHDFPCQSNRVIQIQFPHFSSQNTLDACMHSTQLACVCGWAVFLSFFQLSKIRNETYFPHQSFGSASSVPFSIFLLWYSHRTSHIIDLYSRVNSKIKIVYLRCRY